MPSMQELTPNVNEHYARLTVSSRSLFASKTCSLEEMPEQVFGRRQDEKTTLRLGCTYKRSA